MHFTIMDDSSVIESKNHAILHFHTHFNNEIQGPCINKVLCALLRNALI